MTKERVLVIRLYIDTDVPDETLVSVGEGFESIASILLEERLTASLVSVEKLELPEEEDDAPF